MPDIALVDEVSLAVVGGVSAVASFTKTPAVPFTDVTPGGFVLQLERDDDPDFILEAILDETGTGATFSPLAAGDYVVTVCRVTSLGGQLGDAVTSDPVTVPAPALDPDVPHGSGAVAGVGALALNNVRLKLG